MSFGQPEGPFMTQGKTRAARDTPLQLPFRRPTENWNFPNYLQ